MILWFFIIDFMFWSQTFQFLTMLCIEYEYNVIANFLEHTWLASYPRDYGGDIIFLGLHAKAIFTFLIWCAWALVWHVLWFKKETWIEENCSSQYSLVTGRGPIG